MGEHGSSYITVAREKLIPKFEEYESLIKLISEDYRARRDQAITWFRKNTWFASKLRDEEVLSKLREKHPNRYPGEGYCGGDYKVVILQRALSDNPSVKSMNVTVEDWSTLEATLENLRRTAKTIRLFVAGASGYTHYKTYNGNHIKEKASSRTLCGCKGGYDLEGDITPWHLSYCCGKCGQVLLLKLEGLQ